MLARDWNRIRQAVSRGFAGEGGAHEVSQLAWPLAVGLISYTLMGVTDTLLMAQVGTVPLAGVGLGFIFSLSAVAFFRGLVSGVQSVVAGAFGDDNTQRVREAGSASVLIGVISGVLASLLLWLLLPVLPAMADGEGVADVAFDYASIRVYGLPFAVVGFSLVAALQGLGDTRTRMWVSLAGNVVNIVLDLILIFGWGPIPPMGAEGAAWATVIGSGVMMALYAWRFRARFGPWIRPTRAVIQDTIALGLPSGGQAVLEMSAFSVVQIIVAHAGAAHLAASQIALNIISLSFLPGFGIGEAGGVLVSRYLGASRRPVAMRAISSARSLALGVMGIMALIFLFGGHFIVSQFSDDPEVVSIAADLLILAAAFQIFDALAMVHLCALRGAGDTRFTLALASSVSWGITVPLTWALALWMGWGAPGAWLGLTLEFVVVSWLSAVRLRGLASGRVGRVDLLVGR
ncbi:MAG: MATE family efflux transporter [Bradymonadia bacterium]